MNMREIANCQPVGNLMFSSIQMTSKPCTCHYKLRNSDSCLHSQSNEITERQFVPNSSSNQTFLGEVKMVLRTARQEKRWTEANLPWEPDFVDLDVALISKKGLHCL